MPTGSSSQTRIQGQSSAEAETAVVKSVCCGDGNVVLIKDIWSAVWLKVSAVTSPVPKGEPQFMVASTIDPPLSAIEIVEAASGTKPGN